jgi:hypothetical protein
MGKPSAFISHSSQDKERASELANALRGHGVDVWVDHEQIGFGDSITKKISQGLERSTVILVLISKSFVESSWCRAEYEPLLMNEIQSGNTTVIPIRLDNSEMPILLRTKRYVDIRRGMDKSVLYELASQISEGSVQTVIGRIPRDRSYQTSLLSMVIGGVVKDFPVATMTDEEIVQGRSLIDLYRTIEKLVSQFQDIVDTVLAETYMSRDYQSQLRKLEDTERDMRTLVQALDGVLQRDSRLRSRLDSVLRLCVRIGGIDSGLYLSLGGERPAGPEDVIDEERNDNNQNYQKQQADRLREYQRLLADLSAYRHDLRDAIARLASTG